MTAVAISGPAALAAKREVLMKPMTRPWRSSRDLAQGDREHARDETDLDCPDQAEHHR
jgi:hypothetical protein